MTPTYATIPSEYRSRTWEVTVRQYRSSPQWLRMGVTASTYADGAARHTEMSAEWVTEDQLLAHLIELVETVRALGWEHSQQLAALDRAAAGGAPASPAGIIGGTDRP